MTKSSDFINTFPDGSAEREYHSAIARVLSGIVFDSEDENVGLGLLDFLTEDHFVAGDVDTRTHSIAGSRQENALLVSVFFCQGKRSPSWWTTQSLLTPSVWQDWWKGQFRTSPAVERVFD